LERDNEVTLTWRCKTKDGYHWVETIVKNVACADDECVYKVISSRNIQKRMELETELLKTSEELYNLNQMKDKLFSIIAHDLKSPICSLITMTDFIQQEINTLSKPEIGEFVMSVNDAAKSSLSLLENLLEWTKSQTGAIRYSPEKVKIENVVNECWILAKSQALNKNISCKPAIESNLYAFADYKMFCTVIRNLISNAIKFTKQNGLIEITAFTEKNRVMVIIKDNGIGMNQDLVEFLFQKNPQKQISDDNFKQSRGLGLILCREFMDAQGGSITANSIPGQGSTIFLTLPLSENIDTE
jgi:K+-sensing histidine kinase KdpD